MKKNKIKNKKITVDDLAEMTKRGFDELGGKMDKLGEQITKGFEQVSNSVRILSESNAREHETIFLRLGNVAHTFELAELERRVEVLEKKVGVKGK